MKKLRIILLVLILLVCLIPTSLISTSQLKVEAAPSYKGMCVLANDNKVLYEYNKDVKLPMASTTKIITAIVTLENCDDLDKLITVADESVGIEGTSSTKWQHKTLANANQNLSSGSLTATATRIANIFRSGTRYVILNCDKSNDGSSVRTTFEFVMIDRAQSHAFLM